MKSIIKLTFWPTFLLAAVMFTGCTKGPDSYLQLQSELYTFDASGGENPEEARAYTTVTIAVPNGVAETRASDPTADTDDTNMDIGLTDEYKVTKANLYLFP